MTYIVQHVTSESITLLNDRSGKTDFDFLSDAQILYYSMLPNIEKGSRLKILSILLDSGDGH